MSLFICFNKSFGSLCFNKQLYTSAYYFESIIKLEENDNVLASAEHHFLI